MLRIYDLAEFVTEEQIDDFIESHKYLPDDVMWCTCDIDKVVEDDPSDGSFYLGNGDDCIWWFGPRNKNMIASDGYKWFCFRTEGGKYHKFNVADIEHSKEAMDKILGWIAKGYATDGPELNLIQDEVEFMDV